MNEKLRNDLKKRLETLHIQVLTGLHERAQAKEAYDIHLETVADEFIRQMKWGYSCGWSDALTGRPQTFPLAPEDWRPL